MRDRRGQSDPAPTDGPAGGGGPVVQRGLFVLWNASRRAEDRILADLTGRFDVLRVCEVHWTPSLVERNFERFYSDLPVRGVYHVFNKGAGPFVAVTLVDRSPVLEDRMTSRGPRPVNARFLDAKLQYRDWLDGLGVHCGETAFETERDLTMLLGAEAAAAAGDAPRWNGTVEVLHRDVTGARGWSSADELFAALNTGVEYVAIGDGAGSGAPELLSGPRPPQLLANHYHALHTVLDAAPVLGSPPPGGGDFRLSIDGTGVTVGLRSVDDGFIDPRWARACLAGRVLGADGVYRPAAPDAFAALCYHAVVHAPRLSPGDRERIESTARALGLSGWTAAELADPAVVAARLGELVQGRGYAFATPRDPALFVNFRALGASWPRLRRGIAVVRRWGYVVGGGAIGFARSGYLRARDRCLRRAPWLRRWRSAMRGGQR